MLSLAHVPRPVAIDLAPVEAAAACAHLPGRVFFDTALEGGERLEAVICAEADGTVRIGAGALFIMIGAAPNTDWLSGLVELDEKGFVKTGADAGAASPYETTHPGIFAVGDVRAGSVKRVASSVGEGSVVVSAIWSHIEARRQAGVAGAPAPLERDNAAL